MMKNHILNTIYQGDVLDILRSFPDEFVDCIVTSPPYWGLRDYGVEGQIGLELTLEEYLEKMLAITRELRRILKKSGVMFWNHGDCYGSGRGEPGIGATIKDGWMQRKPITFKCLIMQNYRLIQRMVDEQGWILRNVIIWHKPNHMPSSVKDRFSNSYEPVFFLTKIRKYWFDLDAVRMPHKTDATSKLRNRTQESYNQAYPGGSFSPGERPEGHPLGKNPGDLWTIPTQPFPESHFATFPKKLVEPMIKAGCPQWVCKKCGKARVRISKDIGEKTWHDIRDNDHLLTGTTGLTYGRTSQIQTIGWSKNFQCNWNPLHWGSLNFSEPWKNASVEA